MIPTLAVLIAMAETLVVMAEAFIMDFCPTWLRATTTFEVGLLSGSLLYGVVVFVIRPC